MPDYEQDTQVDVPAQQLFDYLSDVRHLPDYFAQMTHAEPAGKTEVHTTAQVHGHEVEGDAWFKVDHDAQAVAWGAEGESDYHGRLEVSGEGDVSTVTVHLHTERVASNEIDDGLRTTLANIKRLVEAGTDD